MASDSVWEYDAPQYVDFTQTLTDDRVEEYFHYDHEKSAIPMSFSDNQVQKENSYNLRSSQPNTPQQADLAKRNTPNRPALKDANCLIPRRSHRIKLTNTPQKEKTVSKHTAEKENVCSSGTAKRKKTIPEPCTAAPDTNAKPQNDSMTPEIPVKKRPRCSASSPPTKDRSPKGKKLTPKKRHPSSTQMKMDPVQKASQSHHVKRRSRTASNLNRSRGSSVDRSGSAEHQRKPSLGAISPSGDQPSHVVKHNPKLTIPMTPVVLKRQKANSSVGDMKTSEELELEQISKLRKKLAEQRQLAKDSLKKAQASTGHVPVRCSQPPTEPKEFNFVTDQRLKDGNSRKQHEVNNVDFASSLRRGDLGCKRRSKGAAAEPVLTIPQPFKLHENKHKVSSENKFQSTAEILQAFSNKTPDRFRTKPKNKELTPTRKRSHQGCEMTLTIAKTPRLETRSRTRSVYVVSQAELEEKEIEEMKKHKFHAKPVNENIMKNPNCGVQKVEPKKPTKPEEFDLETDRRIRERQGNKSVEEDEHYEFHANPVPKNILAGPVGIKPVEPQPLTKPESPAFALKNRLRSFKQQVEKQLEEEAKHTICPKPVPHFGIPFLPKLSHKGTEIQPFSFEERTKMTLAKKEEKIKKILEEEKRMREFHANPLPSALPDSLPERCPKPPTVPEPFNLKVDQRQLHHGEEWANKIEEEMRQQRAVAQFKARPPVSVYKPPFVPKPSNKPLTDVQEFDLTTEKRSEKWAEIERYRREKEAEMAEAQQAKEKRQQEEEEQERRRLRNAAVHQANPIRRYKPVEIKPSDKPLTVTESPRFSKRLYCKAQQKSGSD